MSMQEEKISYEDTLSVDTTGTSASKFYNFFPALRHKSFVLYTSGLFISLSGSWLQSVALGWLVLKLTNSAFMVGLAAAFGSLPILFFGLIGGVIVDRFDKKKIIFVTQSFFMLFSFILGILTILNIINIYEIFILSFLTGVALAVDHPARQSFAIEMVGKEDLASAISLNSGIFNSSRVIGPALAGFAIALVSIGGVFLINALTFIAFFIALFYVKVRDLPFTDHPKPFESLKEGVAYSFSHSTIRTLLIFSAISAIFGWSYLTLMPVIVSEIYHKGAESLGYFFSAFGAGALISVFIVSWLSKKMNYLFFIFGGAFIFGVSLFAFTYTSNYLAAMLLLFLTGIGLLTQFSTINSTIQHNVEDRIRGRVMSVYSLMFLGMAPFGSFEVGYVAEHYSPLFSLRIGALIILFCTLILFLFKKRLLKISSSEK